jgi:hypothetical protein
MSYRAPSLEYFFSEGYIILGRDLQLGGLHLRVHCTAKVRPRFVNILAIEWLLETKDDDRQIR